MRRLVRTFLPLLLAGSGWAGIAVTDTTVGKSAWLSLSAAGKEKPRLRLQGDAATLELVDGTRIELRSGKASVRIDGRIHVLSPAPRLAEGRLLLPRKAAQELFEAQLPSQFLCEEDDACAFTASEPAPVRKAAKVPAPKAPEPAKAPEKPAPVAAPSEPDAQDTSPTATAAQAKARKDITIVVDAGHGGKDPGASGKTEDGKTVREKDVTLGVAKKLRDALKKAGFKVVMTRDDDHFEELKGRTAIANKAKGDLFISLHCNAVPGNKEKAKGFRVYLLREAQSESDKAIERRENAAISLEARNRKGKHSLSPIEWMQVEHQLNLFTKESERFSGLVVSNLNRNGPVKKEHTGAGQAGFFVLVGALMPSVLVEMGYVSHPAEMLTLSDAEQQERIAGQISRAVESFFARKGGK